MTLVELLRAANQGAPEAQYVIGLCYANGLGVEADSNVAEKWFLKSAQDGFAASQYELSLLLQARDENNLTEAIDWLRKAALHGFSVAQFLYAQYCESGVGMAANSADAFRFCLMAAERGFYPAARKVASMLEQGIGIAIDLEKAFQWYLRAAELGDIDSAASVGRMYAEGIGVEKNESRALDWLREGQKRGSPWALLALSSAYRFGELGQSIDLGKADELGMQAKELIEARAARGSSH
jgi:uncharacterized protein